MAAIIAQLAAANRKRKARRKATLPPDKSNRTLPPFDPCFDPNKHNPYLRLKAMVDHRNEINRTARGILTFHFFPSFHFSIFFLPFFRFYFFFDFSIYLFFNWSIHFLFIGLFLFSNYA